MTYFFDTCALLHNFKKDLPKGFYISSITLKELENIKTSCHKDEEIKSEFKRENHDTEYLFDGATKEEIKKIKSAKGCLK